jgi:Holliday junction DNA helicase RuvA
LIAQLSGHVAAVTEETALVDVGPLVLEVLVPAHTVALLQPLVGTTVRLHTLLFVDGSVATGNLVPRLVGFLSAADRDFFHLLNKVKGVSTRKALRIMAVPSDQIAAAIESGDERLLTSLPEVGKRTAAQMVTELRGQVHAFIEATAAPRPVEALAGPPQLALEIMVSWGDRRADAQRWIAAALEEQPGLSGVDEIVRAAYRSKQKG